MVATSNRTRTWPSSMRWKRPASSSASPSPTVRSSRNWSSRSSRAMQKMSVLTRSLPKSTRSNENNAALVSPVADLVADRRGRRPDRAGYAADHRALYGTHSIVYLDRGAGALHVHLDGHARGHDRRARSNAFRGRCLAGARTAVECAPARCAGRRSSVTGIALTAGSAAAILFGGFFLLIVLRVPVAFALGLSCLPILVIEPRLSPMTLFNETFKAYNSFILLAVPFFLLTANLMNIGGITDRLVRLSRTMVGNWPGSLAQINVLLSVFFAGISGSSTADAASQSKIFIDAQVREGYGLSFSIAITAVSAVLAVIIPPSILMVVWGGVISTSIGALYLAGILPGLLIAGAQMATVHAYAKIYEYPVYPRATLREFMIAGLQSLPALLTPLIIVGGILLGWFTATESACVAVIYAAVLSIFIYREMDLKQLYHALAETGRLAAVALFCVGTASAFGWMLAYYQIPRALLANVTTWGM